MFRPYMCAIFRLRDLTYRPVTQDVWGVWAGGGKRDLVVSIVGTMTIFYVF